jgi:uncharacterized protein (DUF58 family)
LNLKKIFSFNIILEPKERGEYNFGALNVFAISPIGLVSRKFSFQKDTHLACYPSFLHLRKYELMALNNEFMMGGIKKYEDWDTRWNLNKLKNMFLVMI